MIYYPKTFSCTISENDGYTCQALPYVVTSDDVVYYQQLNTTLSLTDGDITVNYVSFLFDEPGAEIKIRQMSVSLTIGNTNGCYLESINYGVVTSCSPQSTVSLPVTLDASTLDASTECNNTFSGSYSFYIIVSNASNILSCSASSVESISLTPCLL